MMRLAPINDIWVYLAASPLLGLTITLLAYVLALAVHQRYRRHPLTNPVLLAVVLLVTLLLLTDTPYPSYFAGAQFVHFLLGPATVALAIPLYAQLGRVRAMRWPVLRSATTPTCIAMSLHWRSWAWWKGPPKAPSTCPSKRWKST